MRFFLAILLVLISTSGYGAVLRTQDDDNANNTGLYLAGLDRIADEFENLLNHYTLETPGAQLAIYKNGLFIMKLAGGVTERGGSTPVSHSTLFQFRSTTKTLAAIGDMTNWDNDEYEITDLVTNYWPGYSKNSKGSTLRLRMY